MLFAVLCILFLKCPHLATYLVHYCGVEVISVFVYCGFINIRGYQFLGIRKIHFR